ncbi:hypothetical protein [Hyphomonas sp.]|uniref:hypothetical protein n=1 Tax=Hyphomonas sp. TaxID=87 RepID=UPI00352851F7
MLLRRFTEHVKAQNWTAVALDFVIVVLGVFIGIQVSNWNAANGERRALDRYMEAVASDIRSDIVELTRVETEAQQRVTAAAYVLRKAGAPDLNDVLSFAPANPTANDMFAGSENFLIPDQEALPDADRNRLWALIVSGYLYDTNRTAFDALISSGNIDLIDDPELMQLLREYYYLVNGLEQTQSRSLAPMRLRAIDAGIAHGMSSDGIVDETELTDLVKSDPSIRATIAVARENAALHLLLARLTRQKAEDVLQALSEKGWE